MSNRLFEFFQEHHSVTQALIATLFTWFFTAADAACVSVVDSRDSLVKGLFDAAG